MKKVGIITHYYGSSNYGGLLQAYALCRVLNDHGYEAEQICYNMHSCKERKPIFYTLTNVKNVLKSKLFVLYHSAYDLKVKKQIICRNKAMKRFSEAIPHSECVYDANTVSQCCSVYDIFITGSDQVWNVDWYYPAFFLSFVSSNKIKISYAASISKDELTDEQKTMIRDHILDYRAISVREESAIKILNDISPVSVQCTLDPTLLLNANQWNEICTENIIGKKYIFCYFLGDDKKIRRIAKQFGERHGLKLVTLPFLSGHYRLCDRRFGNIQLFDITPGQFLTLIKYAEYVFTDSFHASVFSLLFHKQFFVFERSGHSSMSTRITSLMELFNTENRFCDTRERETPEYIESLPPIDYNRVFPKFEEMKEKSIEFLKRNLKKADEMIYDNQ